MYDVIVLGGGPAGVSLALTLRTYSPGMKILILEKTDYSNIRVGETLPPPTRTLLERLGVWDRFSAEAHLPSYSSASVWGEDTISEKEFIFIAGKQGWHLDRSRFDQFMATEARNKNIDLYTESTLVQADRAATNWQVTIQTPEGKRVIQTRFIADTTGRATTFTKARGAKRIIYDKLTGYICFPNQIKPTDNSTLVEAFEFGWWYSAALPDEKFVLACFTDSDIAHRFNLQSAEGYMDFLRLAPNTYNRLGADDELLNSCFDNQLITRSANSFTTDRFGGEGWIAAGDALQAFDPLSSQGIFFALRTGIFAAFAILDELTSSPGGIEKYSAILKQEYSDYLADKADFYDMEQRWPDALFWRRRSARVDVHPAEIMQVPDWEQCSAVWYLHPDTLTELKLKWNSDRKAHEVLALLKSINKELSDEHALQVLAFLKREIPAISKPEIYVNSFQS